MILLKPFHESINNNIYLDTMDGEWIADIVFNKGNPYGFIKPNPNKNNTEHFLAKFKDIRFYGSVEEIKQQIINELKDVGYHYPTEEQMLLL